jgi:hypothetical protein
VTEQDYEMFSKRFWDNMSPDERATFTDVIQLLPLAKMVEQANLVSLDRLQKPVVTCKAEHPVARSLRDKAKKASADDAEGFETQLKLAEGAKIMIKRTLWTSQWLVNGAQGVIQKIWYAPNSNPKKGHLPAVIFVSCPDYSGKKHSRPEISEVDTD